MSLVQTTGKIEPTDFSTKAATPYSYDQYDHGNQALSGTINFTASNWTLNATMHNIDTQSSGTMRYSEYQNKIILIKWGGSYCLTPYYEYGVWRAATEPDASYNSVLLKTICSYYSYYMMLADYVITEKNMGADAGYSWQVTKAIVRRLYWSTSTDTSSYRWRTTVGNPADLYPMQISFLSPNAFPMPNFI